MAKLVFSIIIFSILINFATGIMIEIFPEILTTSDVFYKSHELTDFQNAINGSVSPTSESEDPTDNFDRLLDAIGLGIIQKIRAWANQYMFGFIQLLQSLLGGMLGSSLSNLIFGGIKTILTVLYAIAVIWLFTGKELTGQ